MHRVETNSGLGEARQQIVAWVVLASWLVVRSSTQVSPDSHWHDVHTLVRLGGVYVSWVPAHGARVRQKWVRFCPMASTTGKYPLVQIACIFQCAPPRGAGVVMNNCIKGAGRKPFQRNIARSRCAAWRVRFGSVWVGLARLGLARLGSVRAPLGRARSELGLRGVASVWLNWVWP